MRFEKALGYECGLIYLVLEQARTMIYRFARFLNRLLLWAILRIEIVGREKAPTNGGLIVTGNHIGALDALLVFYLLDRDDIIVMIAEYHRKYAFRRWLVNAAGGLFVDRYGADFTVLRQVLKRLNQGGVLIIAPEGTRTKTGGLQRGHLGAAYLAVKTGLPVLPVGVMGTEEEKLFANLKRFRRAPVTVRAGDPYRLLPVAKENRQEVLQDYTDEIMCRIAALLPAEYHGVYADHPLLKEFVKPL
jgi:1-acyl-sn-glycerol-3-phosphate acyltransferase